MGENGPPMNTDGHRWKDYGNGRLWLERDRGSEDVCVEVAEERIHIDMMCPDCPAGTWMDIRLPGMSVGQMQAVAEGITFNE